MATQKKGREFSGSTVEEAIQKAIKSMGVSREKLNIKVVCEEQRGLFGMQGVSPAKIKVIVKDKGL